MANIYNGIDINRFEPFDSCKSWIPYLIIWNQNSSDKYVPGRTKVKEDEGPRKWVMFIPMGGQNKKY